MADKKISELAAADALDGTEKIPLEQAGVTKSIDSGTYPKAQGRHSFWRAPEPITRVNQQPVNERLCLQPVMVDAVSRTISSMAVQVNTAGETDSVIRLGLYENDTDGTPSALLVDAGTVAADTTGVKTLTVSQAVSNQWIWVAAVVQGASTTPPEMWVQAGQPVGMGADSASDLFNRNNRNWVELDVAGALPDPTAAGPGGFSNRKAPIVGIEVS